MLAQAAESIFQAHQQGLVTILWIYPRGRALAMKDESSLLTGAAGVATALGADFVVKFITQAVPTPQRQSLLELISQAAGTTKVIHAGGAAYDTTELLQTIKMQLSSGSSGVAIGRNIYQHSLADALKLSQEISRLVYSS